MVTVITGRQPCATVKLSTSHLPKNLDLEFLLPDILRNTSFSRLMGGLESG